MVFDVVVIGAGPAGLSAATTAGPTATVALLDAGPVPGDSTGDNLPLPTSVLVRWRG